VTAKSSADEQKDLDGRLFCHLMKLVLNSPGAFLDASTPLQRAALAYSLASLNALSSLYDKDLDSEDGSVSYFHFKRAFVETFDACQTVWPFLAGGEDITRSQIYDWSEGIVRDGFEDIQINRAPNRAAAPSFSLGSCDGNVLLRGFGPGLSVFMSGSGPYQNQEGLKRQIPGTETAAPCSLEEFAGWEKRQPGDAFDRFCETLRWSKISSDRVDLGGEASFWCYAPSSGRMNWERSARINVITVQRADFNFYRLISPDSDGYLAADIPPFMLKEDLNEILFGASLLQGLQPKVAVRPAFANFVRLSFNVRPPKRLEKLIFAWSMPVRLGKDRQDWVLLENSAYERLMAESLWSGGIRSLLNFCGYQEISDGI
jgi:hypothetical protein